MKTKNLNAFINKNFQLVITITYGLVVLFGILFCYHYLPILLNYAPGTINTDFDREFSGGLTYFNQFVLIFIVLFVLGYAVLNYQTRDFKNIQKYLDHPSVESHKKLNKIKVKCLMLPLTIFLVLALVPPLGVFFVFAFLNFFSIADLKVLFIIALTVLLGASLGYLLLKRLFKEVLTYINNTENPKLNLKISLSTNLLLQFFPLIIICTLYTFLITSSSNITEKAAYAQKYYHVAISEIANNVPLHSVEELEKQLNEMTLLNDDDSIFLINSQNQFVNFNHVDVNNFFVQYALKLADKYQNVVYDYYGTEAQGIIIPILINGETVKIVIRYNLASNLNISIFNNLAIVLLFCILSSIYFAKTLSKDIRIVTNNMDDLVHNSEKALNQNLPVTSNDEIGDLIVAFNQIQDLTNNNIHEIENSQKTLMEKERLASLGQLIGGIAHNMKTPIMSISGAAEGLTELVSEYVASIDNPMVTKEDHKEIAKDMLDWITKIKTHTAYMSDILTTVKGQASQLTTSASNSFTVYDLTKRVDILMKHEIKKALLTLEININCDPAEVIHGDINNMIQVVNNLITNAIQAYNGKIDEKVELNINRKNKFIIIQVRDYGCGMSDEVKSKLFKEMITTKGKNGTGLGLYMSYSTIRGKFNGDLTFESEVGVGTTFEITIPV